MGRDPEVTARVVDGSLHSSVNTAYGQSIWLVEVATGLSCCSSLYSTTIFAFGQ